MIESMELINTMGKDNEFGIKKLPEIKNLFFTKINTGVI